MLISLIKISEILVDKVSSVRGLFRKCAGFALIGVLVKGLAVTPNP